MEKKISIAQLKQDLRNEYQPLWDACKSTEERDKVKNDFYALKSIYSETVLDQVWNKITFKTRMKIIEKLDITSVASLQK